MNDETTTPPVNETTTAPVVETPPAADPAPAPIDDFLGDPTPEEITPAAVEPAGGEPAGAVEAIPVDAGAGGAAVPEPVDPEPEPSVEVIVEDGKTVGYKMGRYKADTLEQLVVQIEKGRQGAEKLIGKRKEELAAELGADPFLLPDDEFDELDGYEIVDDVDLGTQIGSGVAQALAQAGFAPQQPDPMQAKAQAMQIAQAAIQSPHTSDQEFRSVLAALIQADPMDSESRQVVLDEWGARNPVVASQEASRIEIAFHTVQQQQAQEQAHQQAMQAYEAEQATYTTQTAEQQRGVAEFEFAQQTFVQQHPDWVSRNDAMNAFLVARPWLMESAKAAPLVNPENPQDRPRARAVHDVLKLAYESSGSAPVAGIAPGVSEQGSNMGTVNAHQHTVDPSAVARSLSAEQRDLASLETGAAVDEVSIAVANPNPPGLDQHSFADLVGIQTVPQ